MLINHKVGIGKPNWTDPIQSQFHQKTNKKLWAFFQPIFSFLWVIANNQKVGKRPNQPTFMYQKKYDGY
jgi:hypothetical protein